MDIIVLDTNLIGFADIDVYESLIWTRRYNQYGDFEFYTKATQYLLDTLAEGCYLWFRGAQGVMIVENCRIKYDAETGNNLIVTGRSIESILDRRIIWQQTVLNGNLQNGIERILNENVINPELSDRRIPNIVFQPSTDPLITALTVNVQYTRDNVYDTISQLCSAFNIGFKMELSDDGSTFVFSLYAGKDRSYNQLINPYVTFSPKNDNLINSDYSNITTQMKNVTVVAGEDVGVDRKVSVVGTSVGLNRREMFTDAREISQTIDGVVMSDAEYLAQLNQKGLVELSSNTAIQKFESKVDTRMFAYGEDFFIGDIVQIESEYDILARARVTELIYSHSTSELSIYPTFTIL